MGYNNVDNSNMIAGMRSEEGSLQMQRYQGYPPGSNNNQLWAEYNENPTLFN